MRLLFIAGPPASGKLTIARLIATRTGYSLFHNHLSIDLVSSLFPKGTERHSPVLRELRLFLLETAAASDLEGVIFTHGYQAGRHDAFLRELRKRIEQHGGEVLPVALTCPPDELRRRVANSDRTAYGKIVSPEVLEEALATGTYAPLPLWDDAFVVDTSSLSPEEAATRIIEHFHLEESANNAAS